MKRTFNFFKNKTSNRNYFKKPKRGTLINNFFNERNNKKRAEQEDNVELNDNDCMDETILCISYGAQAVGAAIYEQSNQTIRIMNDVSEFSDFEYIRKLIDAAEPTKILISNGTDLKLFQYLSNRFEYDAKITEDEQEMDTEDPVPKLSEYTDSINETTNLQYEETDVDIDDDDESENDKLVKLVKMSNIYFKYTTGLNRINELFNTNEESSSVDDVNVTTHFRIDVNSVNMVKSFGALLFYLDDARIGVENEPLSARTPIRSIKTFVIENHVEIDMNTYRALDIFSYDKQGLKPGVKTCLYDLCNKCRSTVGKRCLLKWFKNPTTCRDTLLSRQRCIQYFIQDCNLEITTRLIKMLARIRGLSNIFKKFRNGSATITNWDGFIQTVCALIDIVEILRETSIRNEFLDDEFSLKEISEVVVICKSIIDFDESVNEGRITICTGVDQYLDEYRYTYRSLPSVLTAVAEEESNRLGINREGVSCIYVPIIGYLLSLPGDYPIQNNPEMTLVYKTDSEIRVKNEMTEKLDEEIGDIRMQIIDKETVIILRLKKVIMKRKRKIMDCLRIAEKIDALISLAISAREFGWTCPNLIDDSAIEADELYHPIAMLTTKKQFVPNKLMSGNGTRVSIITGPNACGKSVYMKQVGILAFLAHIGSYVPARRARIGPIDRIVTRMFTVDKVIDKISTFALDLSQIACALRKATKNSLVIIDEFGKGTMMEVGLSLLSSCLTYWINKSAQECPHIFVSSHFHTIFKYIPLENDFVTFLTFQVRKLSGGRIDYAFRLVEGIVNCSFAMSIARDEGVPNRIIDRSMEIYDNLKNGKPLVDMDSKCPESNDGEYCDFVDQMISSDLPFLESFEKFHLESIKKDFKNNSKKTLADYNLVGDTEGIDTNDWDETQNLVDTVKDIGNDDENGTIYDEIKKNETSDTYLQEKTSQWIGKIKTKEKHMLSVPVFETESPIGPQKLSTSIIFNSPGARSVKSLASTSGPQSLIDMLLPPSNKHIIRSQVPSPRKSINNQMESAKTSPRIFSSDEEEVDNGNIGFVKKTSEDEIFFASSVLSTPMSCNKSIDQKFISRSRDSPSIFTDNKKENDVSIFSQCSPLFPKDLVIDSNDISTLPGKVSIDDSTNNNRDIRASSESQKSNLSIIFSTKDRTSSKEEFNIIGESTSGKSAGDFFDFQQDFSQSVFERKEDLNIEFMSIGSIMDTNLNNSQSSMEKLCIDDRIKEQAIKEFENDNNNNDIDEISSTKTSKSTNVLPKPKRIVSV